MGRTKIEREFRDKLEAREIAPSPQAWDRLDAMLSMTESKKEKPVRRIGWIYYAAASVVAILLTALLMTRGDNPQGTIERVVEAPSVPETRANVKGEDFRVVPQTKVSPAPRLAPKNREAVAEVKHSQGASDRQIINPVTETQSDAPQDKPMNIQNPGPGVDELIAATGSSPAQGETKVKVDAGTLLSQVDGELELTFREKVIRTVGKNYKNVKVALANRNQE